MSREGARARSERGKLRDEVRREGSGAEEEDGGQEREVVR